MQQNTVFNTAVDFVNNTSCHVFLTGKAGTGKTTFLKYIKEHTPKRCVVVAPTGVAAINAGGVTMHSFFQLPFGPYVPEQHGATNGAVTDKQGLFKNIKFNEEKRELLRDLELLIIDEVSMVRCDTLDAIDAILRHFRKQPDTVFGGVQVLFIGDLFQLPPVMPDAEWTILKTYYASAFFFHARAAMQARPVYVELKKIYRQREQQFIDLLNRIRNNEAEAHDISFLNTRHQASLQEGKHYITLTSHNYKADKINQEALRKLPGTLYEFHGTVEGDFPEKTLPTDVTLQLKEGAQVMFIRNDKSEERRYYNGKIARVKEIGEDGIIVALNEENDEMLLERETWNNIRYSYNQAEDKIDEEKLGAFSQYPVRLAWAITIHKSQGLTFEHAIIDAGESFAPGQVYVALSRCVSLEGMVLHSRIDRHSISTHDEVLTFSRNEAGEETLSTLLLQEKSIFLNLRLLQTFDLHKLADIFEKHINFIHGKRLPEPEEALAVARKALVSIQAQQKVAEKFKVQLATLLAEQNQEQLKLRISKAVAYFVDTLKAEVVQPLDVHIESLKGASKVKKYLRQVRLVKVTVAKKINAIANVHYGDVAFDTPSHVMEVEDEVKLLQKAQKREKGASLQDTLDLLRAGHSLHEVAKRRGLVVGTIEGHAAALVGAGELDIRTFLSEGKIASIVAAIRESQTPTLNSVKHALGGEFSYGEIRAVMAHLKI